LSQRRGRKALRLNSGVSSHMKIDLNLASFILSVLGFGLGLLQSWSQLKKFSTKLTEASGNYALRKLAQQNERADFYIKYPSALIAQVVRSLFALLFLYGIKVLYIDPSIKACYASEPFLLIYRFAAAFAFAKVVADTVVICGQIRRRAAYHFFKDQGES